MKKISKKLFSLMLAFAVLLSNFTPLMPMIKAYALENITVTLDINGGNDYQGSQTVTVEAEAGSSLSEIMGEMSDVEITHADPIKSCIIYIGSADDFEHAQLLNFEEDMILNEDLNLFCNWVDKTSVSEINITVDAPYIGNTVTMEEIDEGNSITLAPSIVPSVHWDNDGFDETGEYGMFGQTWITEVCYPSYDVSCTPFEGTFEENATYYALMRLIASNEGGDHGVGYAFTEDSIDALRVNNTVPEYYEVSDDFSELVIVYPIQAVEEPEPPELSITVEPNSINFGSALDNFDADIERTITITNTGDIDLYIDVEAPESPLFGVRAFDNSEPLEVGESMEVTVFVDKNSPNKTIGEYNGTYTVYYDDGGMGDSVEVPATLVIEEEELLLHTVTFVTGDGTAVSNQMVEDGGYAFIPEAPTLNNYRFAGWYTDGTGTTEFDFDEPIFGDTYIYALWIPTYVVINTNINSYSFGQLLEGFDSVEQAVTITNAGDVPFTLGVTIPTEDGPFGITGYEAGKRMEPSETYTVRIIANSSSPFAGIPGEYEGTYVFTATEVGGTGRTNTAEVTASVDVLEAEKHQVTFVRGDGETISSINVIDGHKVSRPQEDPIWEKHRFINWYTDSTYGTPFDFDVPIEEDTIIYSNWEELVTVTIDVNGGNTITPNSFEIVKGTTLATQLAEIGTPTNNNPLMLFVGYSDALEDGNVVDENTVFNTDKIIYMIWQEYSIVEEIELELVAPTVGEITTFVLGERTNPPVVILNSDDVIVESADWVNGTCEGGSHACEQSFEGAFIDNTDYYIAINVEAKDGYLITEDTLNNITVNGEEPEAIYEDNGSVLIIAKTRGTAPEPEKYNVTFNTDGGSEIPSVEVISGESVERPQDDPEKDGFLFLGWYTDGTGTTEFDFSSPIEGPTTIYAHWEEINVSISANPSTLNYESVEVGFESINRTITVTNNSNVKVSLAVTNPSNTPFDSIAINSPQLNPGETYDITALVSSTNAYASVPGTYNGTYTITATEVGGEHNSTATVTASITITQEVEPTFLVIYDFNGGTVGGESTMETHQVAFGMELSEESLIDNFGVVVPTNKVLDAVLINNVRYELGDTYILNCDTTIKYLWIDVTPTMYTVTFDSEGGSAVASQEVEEGHNATEPAAPTKDNHNFGGWYTDEECTSAFSFSTPITGDITLHAKWTEIVPDPQPTMYTVTFDSEGGSAVASQEIEEGHNATEPTAPTKDNHNFGGWYTDEECTSAFSFSTPITGDITLHAKWTEIVPDPQPTMYTVTFDSEGGSAVASQEIEEGQSAVRPTDPTQEGYKFVDWYSDSELTTVYSFGEVTEDITIYAKWEKVYDILDGDNQEMDVTEEKDLIIRAEGDAEKFIRLIIDAKIVDPKFYVVTPGSTIITLSSDFLKTLTNGLHTMTYVYDDGTAEATFNITNSTVGEDEPVEPEEPVEPAEPADGTNPGTFDNIKIWFEALSLSVLGLAIGLKLKKKNAK